MVVTLAVRSRLFVAMELLMGPRLVMTGIQQTALIHVMRTVRLRFVGMESYRRI